MNICAIIYGESADHNRTRASLVNFDQLTILHYRHLSDINFQTITSDYVFFISSGDALSTHAAQYVELHTAGQDFDLLYSDEAIIYGKHQKQFNFYKPGYSPDMILSMNYFGSLLCIKTSLLKKIERLESLSDQNFLYELILKTLPYSKKVLHIDEALYCRYSTKPSVSYEDFFAEFDQDAGKKLLENYCHENNIQATILDGRYHGTYRVKYALQDVPLVSIIIPFKDKSELLRACIFSILEKSTYKNFEIIGINNSSTEAETIELMQLLQEKDNRVRFYNLDIPFNFSTINNYAVNNFAKGEHVVFLNNDTEVIAPDWIEAMLEHSQHSQVGVVGAKLLYPDHSIQHCGFVLGGLIAHIHRQLDDNATGYFYFPHIVRNYHALTFACVMIKTSLFKKVDGLYEVLAVGCNDIDFCARISALGYYNVYTPYAVLYHYESKSRGLDNTPEKNIREKWELAIAAQRTPAVFLRDSLYNKHLSDCEPDFSEKISDDLKGLVLIFILRLRRRYRELGFWNICKLVVERLKR